MSYRNYMRITNLARLGLMLTCLALFSTGCANKPCPPARPMMPPTVLLQDVPEPKLRGKTNADLADGYLKMRQALRQSNADKKALREWAKARKDE